MVSKSKEKKSMNKKTKVVIGAVVLCILIGGGYGGFFLAKKEINILSDRALKSEIENIERHGNMPF